MKHLKKKQLPLFAIAGFGPNLLNTIIAIYLVDALQKTGFVVNSEYWTFADKTIVAVGLFSVLKFISQVVDGIIDVPFAALTDNLKSKWGKRRPVILGGLIPLILSYVAFCFPISMQENSVANAIYCGLLLLIFYSAYTMTMVTYYGTYSEVTESDADRFYLSDWKAFIDTIQYALAYALIPVFIGFGVNIKTIGLLCAPLALTMLIALFQIKENSTIPGAPKKYPDAPGADEEEIPIFQSIKLTFQNKNFIAWVIVLAIFFFGLQMFLSGQNVLASGPMGLNGWQTAIVNSAAFAPVPLMLILYRAVMKKHGFRFAFQTALIAFGVAMLTFAVAYVEWFPGDNMTYVRLAIAATGATIGSYGIGAFFAAPYLVPSQLAAVEQKQTGKSHPSMYFAVQGLFTAGVGALSTGLIWPNLRNITMGENTVFGAHLMTYISAAACFLAVIAAIFMPKMYTQLGRKGVEIGDEQ